MVEGIEKLPWKRENITHLETCVFCTRGQNQGDQVSGMQKQLLKTSKGSLLTLDVCIMEVDCFTKELKSEMGMGS